MALDLGIDFDRLTSELGNDLGDVFGKVAGQARGGLGRIADIAQNTGTGLERIVGGGGGVNPLARIAALGGGGGTGLGTIANYGSYGGAGTGLDFVDQLGGGSPFAAFERASANLAAQPTLPEPQTPAGAPTGGAGVGATGADPNTDKWRDLIDQAGAANGVDGDIIQAIMMIESGGNEGAVSAAGAQGLMQVMPFHFQPGENGMDPRTNVMKGAKVLADNYKRWGDWNKAVAAYLGAIDSSGNIAGGDPYTGVSGNEYVRRFNENLQRIKAARATRPAAGGGDPAGVIGRAETLLGTPYQLGGRRTHINTPQAGIDCSEFTAWIYEGQGIDLPWNAAQQFKSTQRVDAANVQVGDLVFFHSTYDSADGEYVTHVGMYAGNGKMIHAGNGGVQYADLSTPYWQQHFAGYGRVQR